VVQAGETLEQLEANEGATVGVRLGDGCENVGVVVGTTLAPPPPPPPPPQAERRPPKRTVATNGAMRVLFTLLFLA
jgi:hypothetical protein